MSKKKTKLRNNNPILNRNLLRNQNTGWTRRGSRGWGNDNNMSLTFPFSEIIENYDGSDNTLNIIIPDKMRRFIISKLNNTITNVYHHQPSSFLTTSFLWKDPNPILWNIFQKKLSVASLGNTITTNDDVTINLQIGFVVILSENNDSIFKHGFKEADDAFFVTTSITAALSKLEEQTASSSTSDILVVLFDPNTVSTFKRSINKKMIRMMSRNNNNPHLPIGILHQAEILNNNYYFERKRKKEKLEFDFYERMICTLKEQVKQIRTKDCILKALLLLNDDTLQKKKKKSFFILPDIKKASKYYKESCCNTKNCLPLGMRREISYHISTKLLSSSSLINILDDKIMQQHYFPKLPSPYFKATVVSDDIYTVPRSIKELESRIQRIQIVLYPLLEHHRIVLHPSLTFQMEMQPKEEEESREESKEESPRKENNSHLSSFSFYYQNTLDNNNDDDDNDEYNESILLLSSNRRKQSARRRIFCSSNTRSSNIAADDDAGEEYSGNENSKYSASFSSYYHNRVDDGDEEMRNEDDCLLSNNRKKSSAGRRKFRNSNTKALFNYDEKEGEESIKSYGIECVSNNFRNLTNKFGMHFSQQQKQQLMEIDNDNDCYDETRDDNNSYNNNNDDICNFWGHKSSLSSLIPIETILQQSSSSDNTVPRETILQHDSSSDNSVPSSTDTAIVVSKYLQLCHSSSSDNTVPREKSSDNSGSSSTDTADVVCKYLQLCLNNNHHKKTKLCDPKENMVNVMNEVRSIHSIPASSIAIGDALVVIIKNKHSRNL